VRHEEHDFKGKRTPSLQIASQSFLDCSDAAGDVTSMSRIAISHCALQQIAVEYSRTVNAELVERLSDLDLSLKVKVGIGELFALS
jgi:hypothetical protein